MAKQARAAAFDLDAVSARDTVVGEDKLEALRAAARRARDLRKEIEDLEERVKEKSDELYKMEHGTLPELFDKTGVDKVGIPAEGNMPAYDAVAGDYYKANISAEWPVERQMEGFRVLEADGHGDVIKTKFTIEFGRGDRKRAERLAKTLDKMAIDYSEGLAVPWNTLTALVKEQFARGRPLSKAKLEKLGATVGRVVNIKPRKEK